MEAGLSRVRVSCRQFNELPRHGPKALRTPQASLFACKRCQSSYVSVRRTKKASDGSEAPVNPGLSFLKSRKPFAVNNDSAKLGRFYNRIFGGNTMYELPEPLQWQALTHKSYDHGFVPFNEKLYYFGKVFMKFHTMTTNATRWDVIDQAVRIDSRAFMPRYSNTNLTATGASIEQMIEFMRDNGISEVMRWKPADVGLYFARDSADEQVTNVTKSGERRIIKECACAIVGALNMQHGSATASKFLSEQVKL